jgi:hypothetical protein
MSLWILGEGQQIRELELGGVTQDKMRKCVKTVLCQKAQITRRPFHHNGKGIPPEAGL